MSQMQLLRLFISERLSAAAEEIFSAVQRTITHGEEEAAHAQQDGHQHGLKQEVQSQCSEDNPQVTVFAHEQKYYRQEWSPESCHNNPSVDQEEGDLLVPEPPAIKEEPPWSSPEGEQPVDMEETDTSALKVIPTSIKSWVHSDVSDTGNEDRKPALNISADHRTVDVSVQPNNECWTYMPDYSVTLDNMEPELGLATLKGNNVSKYPRQSRKGRNHSVLPCEQHSPSLPTKETSKESTSYHCHFCGKEFSHSAQLATHTQIHTGEKLFICPVCGKVFRHGNSVTVHMRIHTEEKPYRCTVCGKEFRHVGNLNVHTRIHTGEKPYACTVCGKKYSRNNLMTKHMAVHTGEIGLSMESVLRRPIEHFSD